MPEEPPQTLLERAGETAAGIGSLGAGSPRVRRGIEGLIIVLIAGFLTAFVVTQWSRLPDYDWEFRPLWLVVAGAALLFFYALQCEAWLWILRALGERLDSRPGRSIWGRSLIARYVPTNALMVVGRVVMAERRGVSKRACLASIVYEAGFAIATAVIAGSYFVITLPGLEDQPARYAIVALIPLALMMLHPRVFHPLANFGLRKLGRPTLSAALPAGRAARFVLVYALSWLAVGLGLVAFAASLHPLDSGDIAYAAAAYPVAFCVAVLTFVVPGGLGTRDAALALSLAAVLPGAVATAIAVGFRIFQTAIELMYVAVLTALGRGR